MATTVIFSDTEHYAMMPEQIGRYKIKYELGRGGMATVYRAEDPRFEREVAVKILPREFLHDSTFRDRFEREAKTIATLEHSAIVPVYDYGEDEGLLYLVMRLMPGGSLARRVEAKSLTLGEAAKVLRRVGAALDEAHKRGLIHRDLKPGNILFDQYDDAYLSDFGIVKLMEAGASLTGTGIVGTPAYMSPEQARGERAIDGRSDVYSLGVILFEMLTGQEPYDADTPMGIAIKHILDPIPDIRALNPDLPDDVEQVITCAMAKDPDDRFETASELAEAVAAVSRGETPATRTISKVTAPAAARSPAEVTTQVAQPTPPAPSPVPVGAPAVVPEEAGPETDPLVPALSPDDFGALRFAGVVFGAVALVNAVARLGRAVNALKPGAFCWPAFIIGPGLLFLAGARAGKKKATVLAIPGSIITGIGLLLWYQSIFVHWESWAYAWTLIPVSVGVGMTLHGLWGNKSQAARTGKGMIVWGMTAFLVLGALMETLINVSGSGFVRLIWPLALMGWGTYWVVRQSQGRSRAKESRKPAR